ncbi:uncharacterized protein SAPINGB_P000928 [Magnusiomyces paraingens]|uniref:Pirin N-terminal domain-containing protein n=1 Tax=Magnusiomyces paraingens TaxID=2606893 RepID=A0A5E8B4V8_9ASCO|nr:uncharacterized protein SAPINGB_P000928 [Saprochaete ingens]VVT45862.1 unnamed protein product [Saprochaete ingens]
MKKTISSIIAARLMAEGVGASVRRSIGSRHLRQLSPFLLLDYMETANTEASFPDHPHRGLETVTYVLQGTIEHEDFTGSRGVLGPGDCQVMTAGKGIMHAEVPKPPENGAGLLPATGIQLWVDLPADFKNVDPHYRDLRRNFIPVTEPAPGLRLYSLSKETSITKTPIWFLYYKWFGTNEPLRFESPVIPPGWASFIYVTKGQLTIGNGRSTGGEDASSNRSILENQSNLNENTLESQLIVGDKVLGEHDLAAFERSHEAEEKIVVDLPVDLPVTHTAFGNDEKSSVEFLICAGQPLEQPVFRDMFFVELSKEDLRQSKVDYRDKTNGFERGRDWKSKIAGSINYKFTYKTK